MTRRWIFPTHGTVKMPWPVINSITGGCAAQQKSFRGGHLACKTLVPEVWRGVYGRWCLCDRKTRKDAFYFYKANWNSQDKFVYIAERRFEIRSTNRVLVTVFSNLPKAELFVNGVSFGEKSAEDFHLFKWNEVPLLSGRNQILVKSGKYTDSCEWYLL